MLPREILLNTDSSLLLIHQSSGYSKMHYKKQVTHVDTYASAVSLLESEEQCYVKAIIIIIIIIHHHHHPHKTHLMMISLFLLQTKHVLLLCGRKKEKKKKEKVK